VDSLRRTTENQIASNYIQNGALKNHLLAARVGDCADCEDGLCSSCEDRIVSGIDDWQEEQFDDEAEAEYDRLKELRAEQEEQEME
jgi:hypothetical protein